MKATIIADKDCQADLFHNLKELIVGFLNDSGFSVELMNIGRNDLAFCKGCFGCWVKKPGECVIDDMMTSVNRNFINSEVVIYLTPVVFGQFSANIKNAIDRWLPNMLPFFKTRPDGSTIHPPRYEANPKLIMIGCGDGLSQEDEQLFIDITKKHRYNGEVLIYRGCNRDTIETLNNIELRMVGGHL